MPFSLDSIINPYIIKWLLACILPQTILVFNYLALIGSHLFSWLIWYSYLFIIGIKFNTEILHLWLAGVLFRLFLFGWSLFLFLDLLFLTLFLPSFLALTYNLCFTSNNDQIPILVYSTRMTCSCTWSFGIIHRVILYLLPLCNKIYFPFIFNFLFNG